VTERVTIVGHVVEPPQPRQSARGLAWTRVRVESVSGGHEVVEATAFGAFAERCVECLTAGDRVVIMGHRSEKGLVADEVAISVRRTPARSDRSGEVPDEPPDVDPEPWHTWVATPATRPPPLVVPRSIIVDDQEDY